MILFEEDWDKYPSAIIHYKTRNKSALTLSVLLKKMGIKNNKFFLALHNPELEDVDPRDPNLTYKQKIMVAEECQSNFWYYIREVAMVPVKGSPEPTMLELNRANIALYWLYFVHITILLIQPRQTGKSLSVDELLVWLGDMGLYNSSVDGVTKNTKLRADEIKRLKDILATLPSYLNHRTKKDTNNTEDVTIKALKNVIRFEVAQKDKASALNIGRGITSANVVIDEIAFIYNIDLTLPTILSSMGAAVENSKKNGSPYGRIFYTTAGFLDMPSGEYVYDNIYRRAFRFKETLYDEKDRDAVVSTVLKNSQSEYPLVLVEMNHRALNKTDQWLKENLAAAMANGERAEADYLLKWSRGTANSALNKKIYKILNDSIKDPLYTEISPQGYYIDWYVSEEELASYRNSPFGIGLDTSDGFGSDDIGMILRDPITGEVIGKGKYNNLSLHEFGEFLFWFMDKYRKSVLIIERKSSAMAILDHVVTHMCANDINPFRRIFNWVVNDDKYRDIINLTGDNMYIAYIEHKKEFGYATSGAGRASRSALYGEVLMDSLKTTAEATNDKDLIHQLMRLEEKNGRIDHKLNEHDDLVFGYMLAYWFFTKAANLEVYGFNPSIILSAVSIKDDELKDEHDKKKRAIERQRIIKEMDFLIDRVKNTDDQYVKLKAISRIISLKGQLTDDEIHTLNIEQQLKEIRESKNKKGGDIYEDLLNGY